MGEGTQCEGPPPVELTSFITKVKGMIFKLNWITETKVDNYGFEILLCTQNNNWKKTGFAEGQEIVTLQSFIHLLKRNQLLM